VAGFFVPLPLHKNKYVCGLVAKHTASSTKILQVQASDFISSVTHPNHGSCAGPMFYVLQKM
jgi:hypothetical protein